MNLDNFLNPKSIVIIGASRDKTKIGYQIFENIHSGGYRGKIFPVNLKAETINGFKAYASVELIKRPVDLAVIVIPAKFVLAEIKKCAQAKIKNIVIISAGFSEIGSEGEVLEDEIKKVASKNKLNILGPNCLGFINSQANLNLTFARARVNKGKIAFISQSGAIGSAALDWFNDKNIGLSYFFSLGNEVDLDGNSFIEVLAKDKETSLIITYLEEIQDGRKFMEVTSKLSCRKPVAVLKAGRTKAGQAAALSHTGSLAGSNEAVIAGLKRSGVMILETLEDVFNLCNLTLRQAVITNPDIYIISNAGGPLVLTTDELEKNELPLGKFSAGLLRKMQTELGGVPNVKNPLDLIGDATAERYRIALENILADKNISNVLVMLTPQTSTAIEKTAAVIGKLGKKYPQKLICASFIGGESLNQAKKILEENSIPQYNYPEEAVRAMRQMIAYQVGCKNVKPYQATSKIDSQVDKAENKQLDYLESFKLIKNYGVDIVENRVIKKADDLTTLKYPVVLKVVGEKIIHKTDKKLLAVNLKHVAEAKRVHSKFKDILKQNGNYCIAQPMVKEGVEMILGFKRDESFGPIIMVGAGGIYAEILKDIQTEVDDVDYNRALTMIQKLKIYPILAGARGSLTYDIKTLAQAIVKVAQLAREQQDIQEFDINPLFVSPKGIKAVDVRVIK